MNSENTKKNMRALWLLLGGTGGARAARNYHSFMFTVTRRDGRGKETQKQNMLLFSLGEVGEGEKI